MKKRLKQLNVHPSYRFDAAIEELKELRREAWVGDNLDEDDLEPFTDVTDADDLEVLAEWLQEIVAASRKMRGHSDD
jgi:hypothetical protein